MLYQDIHFMIYFDASGFDPLIFVISGLQVRHSLNQRTLHAMYDN